MLRVHALSKTYDGKSALSSLSFQLPEGSGLALLGENGSGKSTLLRLLAGIHQPDNGTIYYQDTSVLKNRSFLRRFVGYVPQEPALDGGLTGAQRLCRYGLHLKEGRAAE